MRDYRNNPITESITINAPLARCFALSTRIEIVRETLGMDLVDTGLTSGHITANSRVVWRGWKFGLLTEHHTLITAFAEPHLNAANELTAWFQDSQERGRFAFFQHDHFLSQPVDSAITTLHDEIRFTLPFGPLGSLAATLLLAPHIRKLARQRFALIKTLAEGDGWRAWAPE